MKNLMVVFDAIDYPEHLIRYAVALAKADHSTLQLTVRSRDLTLQDLSYPMPGEPTAVAIQHIALENYSQKDEETIQGNFKLIKDECLKASVSCVGDPSENLTTEELIDRSAFADLVLMDSTTALKDGSREKLTLGSHCPVLLVSKSSNVPKRAILCYDESFSSIYAIKMYSYLFPQWKNLPTHVVTINAKGDNGDDQFRYLQGWLPQHFSQLTRHILEGNLQKELLGFLRRDDQSSLVVMGAYGGNSISRLFHKSLANILLEETQAAVFIMHE
ncbi:MAG: hypothetical protein ACJ75B_15200 [Flavisolibacter sp.]